jgi:hypothetical protein
LDRIIVSWNGAGQDPPLANIHLDAIPEFKLHLFDYSGSWQEQEPISPSLLHNPLAVQLSGPVISARTECKGQILQLCEQQLRQCCEQDTACRDQRAYIAIIDDDILIGISDLNRALHLGRRLNLTTFSPSLSNDSFCNHSKMLTQPGQLAHRVDWVEIMMPFVDRRLFHTAHAFYPESISSWGIDCYVYPALAIAHGYGDQHAVLDAVAASHIRPVTSGERTFSHGLTAHDELKELKEQCLAHLQEHWPSLLSDSRIRQLFGLDPELPRKLQRLKKLARLPWTLREKLRTL